MTSILTDFFNSSDTMIELDGGWEVFKPSPSISVLRRGADGPATTASTILNSVDEIVATFVSFINNNS